jgi:cell division protein FtsB
MTPKGVWWLVLLLITVWGFMPVYAVHATTLEELKQQLEVLQQKVAEMEAQKAVEAQQAAELEAQKAAAAKEAEAQMVTRGAGPGTFNFRLPGIDTDVRLGGYVKLDAVYSDVGAGSNSDSDRFFYPRSIYVGPSADEPSEKLVLTAKQSRLYLKTRTGTAMGDLKIHVEGDVYGYSGNQRVSNSDGWRLRHAYGELGNFMAGQNWSTFMNAGVLPETLDFGGPAGQIFVRQPQVRWTQPFDWGNLQLAAENPETWVIDGRTGVSTSYDTERVPDVVGRINYNCDFGKFSLALMGRELRIENDIADDSTYGGAVSAAGLVPTFGKDDIRFMLNYGNALGRYMWSNFEDAYIDEDGDLEALEQWGGYVAYRHFWLDNLRSSLVYAYAEADNDTNEVGDEVNKRFQSVHTNLIWSPIPEVNLGLEYLWGQRELENDDDGELNRVQFSAQYSF